MNATLLDAVSVGCVIDGRFPLLQELGGTESTSAWLTELDDGWARNVAIKVFPFASVDARATMARWDVARTLSHPHLMPLLDAGRCDMDGEDLLYVVTEFADETLSQILPERPLSLDEAREMLGPVLGALSYLHELGLTHGHLRPTNIMVIDEQLKLSPDFGWCSRRHSIYDPPEAGSGNVNPAADIWSLGILLVEALTQQPPAWATWRDSEPEVPATIPEPFFTICRECLRIDPERRCTLARIQELLIPQQPIEPTAKSAEPVDTAEPIEPIIDPPMSSTYKLVAKILIAAILGVLFLVGAFVFGWNLTPSYPAPASQFPVPAVESPPPAATASAQSTASIAEPVPAPATGPPNTALIKGSVAHQILPDVPARISRTVQGQIRVEIRVEVDMQGNVSRATIFSPGPSRYFANQALHAAQKWKFKAAQVDGHANASTWLLRFQFGDSQNAATASEEFP